MVSFSIVKKTHKKPKSIFHNYHVSTSKESFQTFTFLTCEYIKSTNLKGKNKRLKYKFKRQLSQKNYTKHKPFLSIYHNYEDLILIIPQYKIAQQKSTYLYTSDSKWRISYQYFLDRADNPKRSLKLENLAFVKIWGIPFTQTSIKLPKPP